MAPPSSKIKFLENLIFKTKFLLIITSFLMAAEHALVIKTIYSYCYFKGSATPDL